jgi:hypothetical protein
MPRARQSVEIAQGGHPRGAGQPARCRASSVPVTAPQYFHPDFRFLSPKQRLRRRLWLALACLGVVGIGAAIMAPPSAFKSDAAIAPRDPV